MRSRTRRGVVAALAICWIGWAGSVAEAVPMTYSPAGSFDFASGTGATRAPVALQGGSFTLNASDTDAAAGTTSLAAARTPEPASQLLMAIGIVGLAFFGRPRTRPR